MKAETTSAKILAFDASRDRPLRFVTATSLFDGHDASINVMRRILHSAGVEVIHLGHNRSVDELVRAVAEEDADAIAVSSYQGGHIEFFRYLVEQLRALGLEDVRVFGGGGGVIVPEEIEELHRAGATRIYSPEDGRQLGLRGMIDDMISRCRRSRPLAPGDIFKSLKGGDRRTLARLITAIEDGSLAKDVANKLRAQARGLTRKAPIIGVTGTGGSGKSSLVDELVLRLRIDQQERIKLAVLSIDPTRRRSGGAMLGDRLRMNAISTDSVFMRSLASRSNTAGSLPANIGDTLAAVRLAGFDVIILETPGIGQGDAGIVDVSDIPLYVMTPEYGAESQLEKIEMLDSAEVVAINKFDRLGGKDAWGAVCRQLRRNREEFDRELEDMPVFGTVSSRFNDDGVTALYQFLAARLVEFGIESGKGLLTRVERRFSSDSQPLIPPAREHYLQQIADSVHAYRRRVEAEAEHARDRQAARRALGAVSDKKATDSLKAWAQESENKLSPEAMGLLADWPERAERYRAENWDLGGDKGSLPLFRNTLSGLSVRRVSLPRYSDDGDLLAWLMLENLPGSFPFTAGVFPFSRDSERPTRMFAGAGDAARTNARFHKLSQHSVAKRLSTAFDSVTLYGFDPHRQPDIYGKIGNSGVSIATIDDMRRLYRGFDLCDPGTSVSMTINGPAPMLLAMFFNTAIDQRVDAWSEQHGRAPDDAELQTIRAETLQRVRGTVQADILKENQGQNTCILTTGFSLQLMGDIQEYFIEHRVQNFYSVSISGYHIAEAGANPLTQLAFTLANAFTYVEAYLARGMKIDDFAPNLSFFFSHGMDPEYSVIGRVARRIWAVAMHGLYGANTRSQKLKYHIQTSGRSLHAQEMSFNDIRTTLQALIAVYDQCNSLHTNAHDEAVTTPTEESVRRALAIQLIINEEWGPAQFENPNQGSFLIHELTELVEEAVLAEFARISGRGGVLAAMERGYQRNKIQEESLLYEKRKHDGSLPLIGVNTFRAEDGGDQGGDRPRELSRSSTEEKEGQLKRLADFQRRHRKEAPAALEKLRQTALSGGNVFCALMDAARSCSLGQMTEALFAVGGRYRREM